MEKKLVLGSQSPRRKELLEFLGIPFLVRVIPTEETLPSNTFGAASAKYLALQKAAAFDGTLESNEVLITADTEVWLKNQRMGKPKDAAAAKEMLNSLSGKTHEVISGVCIATALQKTVFAEITKVTFGKLTSKQIDYYIKNHNPFDKAGGYGIQDWIGWVGIEKIEGSYSNVVGLPVHQLQSYLKVHFHF